MPDWFYRTAAQRVLFSLPDEAGRAVALGLIGTLGKNAPGRALIEFMGHMAPDPRLAVRIDGTEFPSPIGLGWRIDPEQRASLGLFCFGVGCIELHDSPQSTVFRSTHGLRDGPIRKENAVIRENKFSKPILLRLSGSDGQERIQFPSGSTLPVLPWNSDPGKTMENITRGVVLQVGTLVDQGWTVSATMPDELPAAVEMWRKILRPGVPLIVSGGIGQPNDAVLLKNAGADLMLLDAGMVFSGPGLVKRCNEALSQLIPRENQPGAMVGLFKRAWFWAFILGAAMTVGGAATLILALTRVLLPYDESYLGLTGETLHRTLPLLFAFMAHDRGTLAGTMLGLGALYMFLAWYGVRRGRHGAKTTVIASALGGFASFFAFFGFGYFDTLHAFVAVVLFQLTVQIMVTEEGRVYPADDVVDHEDASWRYAQWGQLLWVIHAIGLVSAGLLILGIGMTSVFVSEDLGFLCMTAQQVQEMGARMIGVIAHDRATLGGMLLASGVAMLLPVLWLFRRAEAWLWWAMVGLGIPAYAAALGVHAWVDYRDWRHIVPAFAGLGLWLSGLFFSHAYLRGKKSALPKPRKSS